MTYCVGILVDDGLVFASDTRTSASFDDVRVHTKTHVFDFPGERVLMLMSAGNLATTQAMLSRLQRDLSDNAATTLRTPRYLFEVAEYIGQALVAAQAQVQPDAQSNISVESTLILGGQIGDEAPGLFLIYPLGNCIATSPETPYMQLGESKYGKPILDRVVHVQTSLEDAARCAMVSLDATIRCNVSVGPPIDLTIVRRDDLKISQQMRVQADASLYKQICDDWTRRMDEAVRALPRFPWESASTNAPVRTRPTAPTRAPQVASPGPSSASAAQRQQQQ